MYIRLNCAVFGYLTDSQSEQLLSFHWNGKMKIKSSLTGKNLSKTSIFNLFVSGCGRDQRIVKGKEKLCPAQNIKEEVMVRKGKAE